MSFSLSMARGSAAATLQRFFWCHPEWWSLALCGSAWLSLSAHGYQHAGVNDYARMSFAEELLAWVLMIAAMMLPLNSATIRVIAESSLWARRHRAITGFLLGYFTPWLLAGFLAVGLHRVSSPYLHSGASGLIFAAAALWQLTAARNRAMMACHRKYPLAPVGWRADRDCLNYGNRIGLACVASCWPLMLACAFAGHGWVAMLGGMALGVAERLSFRPRRRLAVAVTFALAAYYLIIPRATEWCAA